MSAKKDRTVGVLMLVLTAFIWGTTFVAQSDAMEKMGPFTFSAFRSLIGTTALVALYVVTQRGRAKVPFEKENLKHTLTGGAVCGVILFVSVNFQNIGLVGAAPGKAAFITALYILIVPIIGLFMGKKNGVVIWICLLVSIVGFYLLNINGDEGFGVTVWEILVLLCAFSFSFHIVAVDTVGAGINAVLLSCMQFAVSGVLSALCIPIDIYVLGYALPDAAMLSATWFNILYAGILSSGVAYTLQIAGQKRTPTAIAVLLMSLESVFAVIAAWIFDPVNNALTTVQIVGCVLIFAAICVSQVPLPGNGTGDVKTEG